MGNTIPIIDNKLEQSNQNIPIQNKGPQYMNFIKILGLITHKELINSLYI